MELQVKQAEKWYFRASGSANRFYAVEKTDLTLAPGTLTVLTGRSGSGKTTLLHMMAGLLRPDGGTICVDGQDLYAMDDKILSRFRNRHFGVIPQSTSAIPNLTVMENLAFNTELAAGHKFVNRKRMRQIAREALSKINFDVELDRLVGTLTVAEKQNLLAHEMVHNWPHLNDNPYGVTTWYAEGTAEYYSIMIPLRNGLITKEQALLEIQQRTDAYYTNPTRHYSNLEAAKICWQDRRAQRLSYGRGIFFLANADAGIRRTTRGKYSIDDVVLDILEQGRQGATLGNEVFLETVQRVSGLDLTDDWRTMHEGGHFAPDPDSFGSLFTGILSLALAGLSGSFVISTAAGVIVSGAVLTGMRLSAVSCLISAYLARAFSRLASTAHSLQYFLPEPFGTSLPHLRHFIVGGFFLRIWCPRTIWRQFLSEHSREQHFCVLFHGRKYLPQILHRASPASASFSR